MKRYIPILLAVLALSSCSFLETDRDNVYTEDVLKKHPALAEGVLLTAYSNLPGAPFGQDAGTDNAVANNAANAYRLAATGSLNSSDNAYGVWKGAYENIAYLNHFLADIVDEVAWSSDPWTDAQYRKRLTAEARGLRAYFYMQLLEAHAGPSVSGDLLGVPMILEPVSSAGQQIVPRPPFDDCVELVLEDLQYAIDSLPEFYRNASASMDNKASYDAVYGVRYTNRMSGIVAKMLKARLLYWCATPAFNPEAEISRWQDAAEAAADVIDAHGGLAALAADRLEFYLNETCTDLLWRKDVYTGHNWESENFPPSLYGTGRFNPSQNLVDAFPGANGFPISNPLSMYDPSSPYSGRDPRLNKYVVMNGSTFKGQTINTISDANDGLGKVAEKSTRTGYYMCKYMDQNVNLVTGAIVNTRHFVTLLRYTEAYLIYAECAFEAYGRKGSGGRSYSSEDVVVALRASAGISDTYFGSDISDAEYRAAIQNERRIELCFEGFRYWDIRRHLDYDAMKEAVRGTTDGGISSGAIEERKYEDYMAYGPIPFPEVKKGLVQNKGWK